MLRNNYVTRVLRENTSIKEVWPFGAYEYLHFIPKDVGTLFLVELGGSNNFPQKFMAGVSLRQKNMI